MLTRTSTESWLTLRSTSPRTGSGFAHPTVHPGALARRLSVAALPQTRLWIRLNEPASKRNSSPFFFLLLVTTQSAFTTLRLGKPWTSNGWLSLSPDSPNRPAIPDSPSRAPALTRIHRIRAPIFDQFVSLPSNRPRGRSRHGYGLLEPSAHSSQAGLGAAP